MNRVQRDWRGFCLVATRTRSLKVALMMPLRSPCRPALDYGGPGACGALAMDQHRKLLTLLLIVFLSFGLAFVLNRVIGKVPSQRSVMAPPVSSRQPSRYCRPQNGRATSQNAPVATSQSDDVKTPAPALAIAVAELRRNP